MEIMPADPGHASEILEIVNREIREGVAHFGTTEHSLADVRAWIADHCRYPVLVATGAAGTVLGYARAAPWKAREAYRWSTEIGVYVRPDSRGAGVGGALYRRLIPMLFGQGYRTVIAGIALPNEPSVRLHEDFGMTHVGTFPRVGYKLGRWVDVGYWMIAAGDGEPQAIASPS